jgi:hypothetical protein
VECFCCDCNSKISKKSIRCRECFKLNLKKISENKVERVKIPRVRKPQKTYCKCGNDMNSWSNQCMQCNILSRRKSPRPCKEELEKLILDYPLTKLGEMFGVSDNAIRKWCKSVGITEFPNNKYRQNVFHGKQ